MEDKENMRHDKEQKICALKARLSATDYKAIKCLTAKALGEDAPYDLAEVEADRQKCRDEIDALRKELGEE